MARIEKKSWPEQFEAALRGEKRFDVRLGDLEVQPGDTLVLREWDPVANAYTGRSLEKRVTYVLRTKDVQWWPDELVAQKGLAVLSLE